MILVFRAKILKTFIVLPLHSPPFRKTFWRLHPSNIIQTNAHAITGLNAGLVV